MFSLSSIRADLQAYVKAPLIYLARSVQAFTQTYAMAQGYEPFTVNSEYPHEIIEPAKFGPYR